MKWADKLKQVNLREKPNDVFFTPAALAKELIAAVPIEPGDSLLDPFAGAGVWFDNYPEGNPKEWAEVERGRDFWAIDDRVDWIITNPPFSKLTAILERSCYLSQKGFAYLLPLNALSFSRLEKISRYGFHIVKLQVFKNPKAWNIGFQMCFVVWSREPAAVPVIELQCEDITQAQLFSFS